MARRSLFSTSIRVPEELIYNHGRESRRKSLVSFAAYLKPTRAQYTVTMFLIDVSPTMGKMREVETPLPNGETQVVEMSNLEWSIQFVKMKIQEMVRV